MADKHPEVKNGRRPRPLLITGRRLLADRLLLLWTLRVVSPGLLIALVTIGLLSGMAPSLTALATAFLVDRLLATSDGPVVVVALPIAAFSLVVLMGRISEAIRAPLEYLAVQRVDGAQRHAVVRLASTSATLAALERPHIRELLWTAKADQQSWVDRTTGQGAVAQLGLSMRYAGAAASCLVLAAYAWWFAALFVTVALAHRQVHRRRTLRHMAMARTGTVEGLEADHWLRMATESTGGKEVRTFSLAKWAVNRSQQHQMAMCQPRWDRERLDNMALWKTAVIIGPASVFGFVCIAYDAASGRIAIPILTSAFAAAWSLLQTLDPWDSFDIEGGLVSRRAYEELRTELRAGESPAAAHAGAAAPGAPRIRFEEVGFTYPETDRPVLDGLELEIHPGELVAVVGLNGAGKSTLIKLLSGLYQPCTGRITADGVDISELGAETWSEQLSVIFQDFVRYPLSVAENVALGRAIVPVDTAALKDVARHTGLDKLIATLPNGWDTPLSPSRKGGVDLSGGQWQQILLARALYAFRAGARLLVMDEPTAHLDVRSEMAVFTELAAHRGRASVVLISHRLSTVRQADRIVLLRDGRVTESGTHDALMELRGTYARLFTTQAQRFHQDTDHVSGAYRKESL